MSDCTDALRDNILDAITEKVPLNISGGGSKSFYGRTPTGESLSTACHSGIINYEPKELVLTARSGTLLSEVVATLESEGQMLPFEPPLFSERATIGGVIATGLSGPARPYRGSVRDYVLGIRVINGMGENLRFGGEVMKNVAGYDVSRLMVGALGTLGLILDVSFKILPKPEFELSLAQQCSESEAIRKMNQWAGSPYPLTATCYDGQQLFARFSGAERAVRVVEKKLGGDRVNKDLWTELREQQHAFFKATGPLWRFSLPSTEHPLELSDQQLIEWGGALRWIRSRAPLSALQDLAVSRGGHVTCFRGGNRDAEVFQPLDPVLMSWHQRLKQSFDPHGVFNPGRFYQQL